MSNKKYCTEDWNQLLGFHVDVHHDGRIARTGTVIEASPDSSAVWLAADGVWARTLIHRAEAYKIWIDEEHLAKLQSRLKTNPVLG